MRVEFDRVTVALDRRTVLNEVSLEVASGSFLGLVGPNGCGKSTLLRTLYRRIRPHSGRAMLDGTDVWKTRPRELARSIAVMTQDSNAEFDLTVLEVVLLARVPHQRGFGQDSATDLELAWDALTVVDATSLAHRQISQLSGGQRQRVFLARALAQDSPVIVLDEPTNHLDIAFQLELMRVAATLGKTVIAALHDLNLAAAHCDAIAVLRSGELVDSGEPHTVLNPQLIREVFRVDSQTLRHPRAAHPVLAFGHLADHHSNDSPSFTPHPESSLA